MSFVESLKMKRVLFVCTGNRARSQMAEGLLRHLAGDRFEVFSAGTEPKGMAPLTIEVMREIGIDASGQRSKSVDEFAGQAFEYVISVCDSARQVCPAFPGKGKRLHWAVEDPSDAEARGMPLPDALRAAREKLRERIEAFLREESREGPAKAVMRLPFRQRFVLFWRLLRDGRVPLGAKLVLPAVGLYLLFPLDVIPDFVPVLGYLDDLLVVILGLWLFLRLCPRELFEEHIERIRGELQPVKK